MAPSKSSAARWQRSAAACAAARSAYEAYGFAAAASATVEDVRVSAVLQHSRLKRTGSKGQCFGRSEHSYAPPSSSGISGVTLIICSHSLASMGALMVMLMFGALASPGIGPWSRQCSRALLRKIAAVVLPCRACSNSRSLISSPRPARPRSRACCTSGWRLRISRKQVLLMPSVAAMVSMSRHSRARACTA